MSDSPLWLWALERLLSPVAALVYGSESEGHQPSGIGAKLFALTIVLALAGLAWVLCLPPPE